MFCRVEQIETCRFLQLVFFSGLVTRVFWHYKELDYSCDELIAFRA